jgi:hypothetical protein
LGVSALNHQIGRVTVIDDFRWHHQSFRRHFILTPSESRATILFLQLGMRLPLLLRLSSSSRYDSFELDERTTPVCCPPQATITE